MNNFKYKFAPKFEEILGLQVTQAKENKDFYFQMSASEYALMKPHLNNPKTILELGCGLGRFSIFLSKQLDDSTKFYLADFSEISNQIKYGWNPKESKYNNLDFTKEFCELNDFYNFEIINLSNQDLQNTEKVDLIVSVLSVGFHYPIANYLELLIKILNEDGVIIFGIREGIYKEADFKNHFKEVIIMKNNKVSTKEDILILKGKL